MSYKLESNSKSLYNISQSKGWTDQENEILRMCLAKVGIGNWTDILRLGVLPGKNIAQISLQSQRMLGIQSLGGFMNLKVDANVVQEDNLELVKSDKVKVLTKNGLIVNSGQNPTKDSRAKLIQENRQKYNLTEEQINKLVDEDKFFALKRLKRQEYTEYITENLGNLEHEEKLDAKNIDKEIEQCKKQVRKLQVEYYKSVYGNYPKSDIPFEIMKEIPQAKKKK